MSCQCPAWRNQSLPIEQRTCKHLRAFRGTAAEDTRVRAAQGGRAPQAAPRPAPAPPSRSLPGGRSMGYPATTRVQVTRQPNPSAVKMSTGPAPAPFKAPPATAWDRLLGQDPFGDDPPPPPFESEKGEEGEAKLQVLLAQTWDNATDPTGYLMSEKLDGVRAYWDGRCFRSRLDNEFHVPDWFLANMPKGVHLDGEFWMGRGKFQETSGFVRRHDKGEYWNKIDFRAFDVPSAEKEPFTKRYDMLKTISAKYSEVKLVEHQICRGIQHLKQHLADVEKLGGEGLMLRKADSLYVRTRSDTLLKVKTFFDAEAKVIGYTKGRGKHRGKVGALECEAIGMSRSQFVLVEKTAFSVGTGLSDADRSNPPPIGSVISFRFQELTNKGVPRFPSYVGRRNYE